MLKGYPLLLAIIISANRVFNMVYFYRLTAYCWKSIWQSGNRVESLCRVTGVKDLRQKNATFLKGKRGILCA
jgi:hypothetical protein